MTSPFRCGPCRPPALPGETVQEYRERSGEGLAISQRAILKRDLLADVSVATSVAHMRPILAELIQLLV